MIYYQLSYMYFDLEKLLKFVIDKKGFDV